MHIPKYLHKKIRHLYKNLPREQAEQDAETFNDFVESAAQNLQGGIGGKFSTKVQTAEGFKSCSIDFSKHQIECDCGHPSGDTMCRHAAALVTALHYYIGEDPEILQGKFLPFIEENIPPFLFQFKKNQIKDPVLNHNRLFYIYYANAPYKSGLYHLQGGKFTPINSYHFRELPPQVSEALFSLVDPSSFNFFSRELPLRLSKFSSDISNYITWLVSFKTDSNGTDFYPVSVAGILTPKLTFKNLSADKRITKSADLKDIHSTMLKDSYKIEQTIVDPETNAEVEVKELVYLAETNKKKILEGPSISQTDSFRLTEPVASIYIIDYPMASIKPFFKMNTRLTYTEMLDNISALRKVDVENLENFPEPFSSGPYWVASLRPGMKDLNPILVGTVHFGYFPSSKEAKDWKENGYRSTRPATFFAPNVSSSVFGVHNQVLVQGENGYFAMRSKFRENKILSKFYLFKFKKSTGEFEIGTRYIRSFLQKKLPALQEKGLLLRLDTSIRGLLAPHSSLSLDVEPSGIDWFSASLQGEDLTGEEIAAIVNSREKPIAEDITILPSGRWVRIDAKTLERLKISLSSLGLQLDNKGNMENLSRGQITALLLDFDPEATSIRRKTTILRNFDADAWTGNLDGKELPTGFTANLRDYQKAGYQFLLRIHYSGLGGILADDMGLGKTVQTLAFLSKIFEENSNSIFLIVVPLAALSVWEQEVAKFAPNLPVTIYHGAKRKSIKKIQPGILLTSYGILKREIQTLEEISFTTVILDEAQALKNHLTRNAKSVRFIKSKSFFALTGTPLENRLSELWSIYDIVFHGLLGKRENFLKEFVRDNPVSLEMLKNRIQPFLLRRLKSEVAKELPERTEIDIFIPMTEYQKGLYEKTRREALSGFTGLARHGLFRIFTYLTRLRRIACHPDLENKNADYNLSGKMKHFADIAEELATSSHGVLVFSQFTDVLGIAARILQELKLEYHYLDGSTPAAQRKAMTQAFQAGEHPFFLISLRAGGTALTLHRADTVIHLDPWWNPMVEQQATDRAHRIGQKNPVMVYRLFSQDTVEEKVLALQDQKRDLFNSLFGKSSGGLASMSKEEIIELLTAKDEEE